jgi:hypothetical protein
VIASAGYGGRDSELDWIYCVSTKYEVGQFGLAVWFGASQKTVWPR